MRVCRGGLGGRRGRGVDRGGGGGGERRREVAKYSTPAFYMQMPKISKIGYEVHGRKIAIT